MTIALGVSLYCAGVLSGVVFFAFAAKSQKRCAS